MKSIQQLNIDNAISRMNDSRRSNNEKAYIAAREELELTLRAIENADQNLYLKYSPLLREEF